jgi:hypothetical protein
MSDLPQMLQAKAKIREDVPFKYHSRLPLPDGRVNLASCFGVQYLGFCCKGRR